MISSVAHHHHSWRVLFWSWDSTPERAKQKMHIEGAPDSLTRSTTNSSEHFVQLGFLMQQSGTFAPPRIDELLARPIVIPDTTAGTILAAIQQRWDDVGAHPCVLAAHTDLLILCVVVDAASSNLKLLRWLRHVLPRNALLLANVCALHQCMRIVHVVAQDTMSNLYSLGKLMSHDSYYRRFSKGIARVVRDEFEYIQGLPPPEEFQEHHRTVVLYCCNFDIGMDEKDIPPERRCRFRKVKQSVAFLNGDWRHNRVQHYCRSCCSGPQDAAQKAVVAALDLLCATVPPTPALTRWGKQLPAAGWWLLGLCCNGIFRKAFAPATEGLEDMLAANISDVTDRVYESFAVQEAAGPDESWREEFKKRRTAGQAFLHSVQDNVRLAINTVALSSLQHIVNGLMGEAKESCMNGSVGARAAFLTHIERSTRVMADISGRLCTEFSLADKVWCILPVSSEDLTTDLVLLARDSLLQSVIGVFVRNIVVQQHAHTESLSMPFALMAFPELHSSEQEQWAVDFFDSPECCLDYFALSVKKLVGTPLALCSPDVQAPLRHAAHSCIHTQFVESRHGRTRNYRSARSQIRGLRHQASQYVIREAQRIHREDVLAKFGKQRKRRKPKKKTKKTQLKKDKKASKKAADKQLPAKLVYINQQASFHKVDHGKVSKEAHSSLRKAWSAEFDILAPDEKEVFRPIQNQPWGCAGVEPGASTDLVPTNNQIYFGHLASGTIDHIIHPSLVDDVFAKVGGCLRSVAGGTFPESELVLGPCFSGLPAAPKTELGSHLSCDQRHYGFCTHRHAAIDAKAKNIHAWLKHIAHLAKARKSDCTRHICIVLDAGPSSLACLYVRSLRQVTTGQTFLLFVKCTLPEQRAGRQVLRLAVDEAGVIQCRASWQIAVSLSSAEAAIGKEIVYDVESRVDEMIVKREATFAGNWLVDSPPKRSSKAIGKRSGAAWQAVVKLGRPRQQKPKPEQPPQPEPARMPIGGRFEQAMAAVAGVAVLDKDEVDEAHDEVAVSSSESSASAVQEDDVAGGGDDAAPPLPPPPRPPAAPGCFQDDPQHCGYIMQTEAEDVDKRRACGRITEWPKGRPKNVSAKCYIHGASKCYKVWPAERAPSKVAIIEWIRCGTHMSMEDHLRSLPP